MQFFFYISTNEMRKSFKKYQTVKYLYISTNFQNPNQIENFGSKKRACAGWKRMYGSARQDGPLEQHNSSLNPSSAVPTTA